MTVTSKKPIKNKLDFSSTENCGDRTIDATYIVEKILGYKWTLTILRLISRGINRPGTMVRNTPGLTTKVLNEQLIKLIDFGIIKKNIYSEIPPHVEYVFTDFGLKFIDILDLINNLEAYCQNNSSN